MKSLSARDDGRSIEMRVGEQACLRLPENASTGYRWAADLDEGCPIRVEPLESGSISAKMGSGRNAEFLLTAMEARSCRLRFKYWREWEGDSSIAERFELGIDTSP